MLTIHIGLWTGPTVEQVSSIQQAAVERRIRLRKDAWMRWAKNELEREASKMKCTRVDEPFYNTDMMAMCLRGFRGDGEPVRVHIRHRLDWGRPGDTALLIEGGE